MEERILAAKKFIQEKFPRKIQMFNTRNIVGDPMYTIYEEDGVVIDFAYEGYIEVFGVSQDEFEYLRSRCDYTYKKDVRGSFMVDLKTRDPIVSILGY